MTGVAQVLRQHLAVVDALGELVAACHAGAPTAAAADRLDQAVSHAEQLLATQEPHDRGAGDDGLAAEGDPGTSGAGGHDPDVARTGPEPAPRTRKKRTAKKAAASTGRRRSGSAPVGRAGGEPPPTGSKRCGSCDTVKPFAEFGINRSKPDGLQTRCKPCHRAESRASAERRKQRPASTAPAVADPVDREQLRARIAQVRDSDPAEAKRLTDQLLAASRDEVRK